MKTTSVAVLALVIPLLSCTSVPTRTTSAAPVTEFSFRGKAFGNEPTVNMIKDREFRNSPFFDTPLVAEYTDRTDDLFIGQRRLDRVSYVFFENRLFKIEIEFQNDRLCSSARGVVPAIEAQYDVTMRQPTPTSRVDLFLAQAKRGDVRITSLCRQENGKWWSNLSFDYMPEYSAAETANDLAEKSKQQDRIRRDRESIKL